MQLLIAFVLTLAGGIVGAFIVHWLTQLREHNVWVRDYTLKEWRELLDELTRAYMTLLNCPSESNFRGHGLAEGIWGKAISDADIVFSTRIFIAGKMAEFDLRAKWADLVNSFHRSNDRAAFMKQFQSVWALIIEAATSIK